MGQGQGISVTLLLSPWFWLALALAALGGMTKLWLHERDAFTAFRAQTEAIGKQAEERATARIKQDKLAKEKSDAENQAAIASLASDNDRLRIAGARGSTVPAAAAGSSRPDLACFDRAQLGAATDDFVAEVSGQVEAGAKATVDLDTAKGWVKDIP